MFMQLIISAAIITLGIWVAVRRRQPRRKLPPGPTGWPIIGNLFDMPQERKWIKYTEWENKYGPLTYLNVGGLPILIVNSHRVVVDLLVKRGVIYSGRPRSVMCQELLSEHIISNNSHSLCIMSIQC